ncbi:hypothetical protein HX875_29110 [Pseudomonas yamanorum]|uniref:hypothetical protein n=1 Tax=Pseudomonas yamanorum TaxID=515393 RepID=UPI0015A16497|nr:hypothetical protein [Pseudomonas yamanorum]NWE43570.1 hypothetical protein [Pseudomonas yamanorum]
MTGRDRHERHDPLSAYNLPAAVHAQAATVAKVRRAADRAEGFGLGLETVKALNAASLEALYVAFDHADTARELELEG